MRRHLVALLALGLAACTGGNAPTAPDRDVPTPQPELAVMSFGITQIGAGGDQAQARRINDQGQVAGQLIFGSTVNGFLWANGTTQRLGTGELGGSSTAHDVNAAGLVVGNAQGDAAVWIDGVPRRLAQSRGDGLQEAIAVNAAGGIVGWDIVSSSNITGLYWANPDAVPQALATLGGAVAVPIEINRDGMIVGRSTTADGVSHAAVWSGPQATPQALKGFDGAACSSEFAAGWDVNELGEIVGLCGRDGFFRAAYWVSKDAEPIDLSAADETSQAFDINELGQIVGSAGTTQQRPTLWVHEGGAFRSFDLGLPANGLFGAARGINNRGGAAGQGGNEDGIVSYVWSVPARVEADIEPGSAGNVVKLDGRGTIKVAALGSRWFQAPDIDPLSLTLGNDDGLETRVARRKATAIAKRTDVNRDGFTDLVAEFPVAELMDNGDLVSGLQTLVLQGLLLDGTRVRGTDLVTGKP